MIALLLDIYLLVVWLVFFRFKLMKFDLKAKISVGVIGVLFCFGILIAVNFLHPQSMDTRVYEHVVGISTRLPQAARVTDVPARPNVPIRAGEVLFKVDAQPYEIAVAQAQAALSQAEQNVPQLKAAYDAAVANRDRLLEQNEFAKTEYDRIKTLYEKDAATAKNFDEVGRNMKSADAGLREAEAQMEKSRLAMEAKTPEGENVDVAQAKAQLAQAQYDLSQTTVTAPADGFLVNLQLEPGFVVSPGVPVMTFVRNPEGIVVVTLPQEYLGNVESGNDVEVCLDMYPGETLPGKVDSVIWASGQGQLTPGGTLPTEAQPQPAGRFAVRVQLTDDVMQSHKLPAGASGAAAIYTDHGKPFQIIRKVVLRWYTWLNYIKIAM
jgi:multidrug resistance efflux pump